MYKYISALLMSLALISSPALAGTGHSHGEAHGHSHGPIKAQAAGAKSKEQVAAFVKAGKLADSWLKLEPVSVEQKSFSKGPEWVITFKNEKVKDTSKQTLYFFYSLDGRYIAANYTGN